MTHSKCKTTLLGILVVLALAVPVPAQTITNDDSILRHVLIFGRHGVRSPTMAPADFARFSVKPYPDFGVSNGYLTPHGQQAETLLGTYYRDYLLHERLLTGDPVVDAAHSYFRANSIQRSNLTATKLGAGLFPGLTVDVHSYPLGTVDAVFDPVRANVAKVDAGRAATEVRRIYNSGTALTSAYSGELSLIRSVLFDYQNGVQPAPATPSGIVDATSLPVPLDALTTGLATGNVIDMGGLMTTMTVADPFVMEYANGLPMKDVGWGRISADAISQQTRLVTLAFNIALTAPYLNQVQSSNAASHVLRSMRQAVLGEPIRGAFGDPDSRLAVVISSDAYVIGLAGLLNMHWQLPGYQPDFCPPGGALVFETRQSRRTGEYFVRAFFTAQSMDQLRNLTPLTLTSPPQTTQLIIPGAYKPGGGLDVPFETFEKLLRTAIGHQYVEDPSTEIPPTVLATVPLQ